MNPDPVIAINYTTLEETVNHITPDFPYMTSLCDLHDYPNDTFPWHWHNEVEFFYMREGQLDYILPGGCHTFRKGEGGFINANVLHMTCSPPDTPCLQEEHIFLPQFIGGPDDSLITHKYILPILHHPGFELFRLEPKNTEHAAVIKLLKEAYEIYTTKPEGYEFDIRCQMSMVWKSLYALTKNLHLENPASANSDKIKNMMLYISQHYTEKLSLKQIADSGFISTRECNRCFHDNLGLTPFSYLMDYRLRKACNLLSHTDLTITEIAVSCGFSTSSYFGKSFREKFDCSPKEYRTSATHLQ